MVRWLASLLLAWCALASAAEPGTLARIREKGEIRLGYISGAAPFSFAGEDGKAPQGYSADLCRRIAEGVRDQLELKQLRTLWVPLTVQSRLAAVRERKVDIECSTTTWTLSRQRDVDFSLIVFVDGASVLTRRDAQLAALPDLKGKRIAVLTGTTTQQRLREALYTRRIDAEIVPVTTRDDAMKLLAANAVDGLASDRMVLLGLARQAGTASPYKVLDEDFSLEPYAFAIARGDPDFRLAVNRVLAGVYRSGEINAIYDRWLGPIGRPSLLLSAAFYLQGLGE
jgi:ABC-type amino acid transport substrate-binding protein